MKKSPKFLIKMLVLTAIMLPVFNYNSSNADLIALPKEKVEQNNKIHNETKNTEQQKTVKKQELQVKDAEKKKQEEQLKATKEEKKLKKETKKQKKLAKQKTEKGVSE